MIEKLLPYLDVIVQGVFAAVGFGILALFKLAFKSHKDRAEYGEAVDALREGTALAQDDFVSLAKRASKDGKLSKDERREATSMAWDHAKTTAKGPAGKIVLGWTIEKVSSLVKGILKGKKK